MLLPSALNPTPFLVNNFAILKLRTQALAKHTFRLPQGVQDETPTPRQGEKMQEVKTVGVKAVYPF